MLATSKVIIISVNTPPVVMQSAAGHNMAWLLLTFTMLAQHLCRANAASKVIA